MASPWQSSVPAMEQHWKEHDATERATGRTAESGGWVRERVSGWVL